MSPQNTIRTGRNLGTQAEALRDPERLRPSVAPPAASYVEKRPDYIARPSTENSKMAQLGQALSRYIPHLDRMAATEEERFRTAEQAKGMRAFQLDENKRAFAEYSQAHPERVGDNPHFQRGYKGAHLESLAIAHNAAMQERYTRELMGETDPMKVKTALDAASAEWIQANVTGDDFKDDPDLYADFFYQPASNTLAGLMGQHGRDAAAEHLRRNTDTYSKLVTSILDNGIMSTAGLGNPDAFAAFLSGKGGELSGLVQRMIDDGTPPSLAQETIEKAVFAYAASLGGETSGALGPQMLKLLDHITTADGQPLSAKAATRAGMEQQTKEWRNERRSNIRFAQEQEDRARIKQDRKALNTILGKLTGDIEAGRPMTPWGELMKLEGVTSDHILVAQEAQKIAITLRGQKLTLDPATQREVAFLRMKAYRGELTPEELLSKGGRFGWEILTEVQNIMMNAESGNDPVSKTMKGVDMGRAYRLAQTQLMATGAATGATPEMIQAATEEVLAYSMKGMEDRAKEEAANGKVIPPWQADSYLHNIITEAAKNPAFRDFTKPRDIRPVEEMLGRYPELRQTYDTARNPSFDPTARVKELLTTPPFPKTTEGKNMVGDLIACYLQQPVETGRRIAGEYGVGIADVPGLMDGWASTMMGVPLNAIAQDLAKRKAKETRRAETVTNLRDRLSPVLPEQIKDKYEQYQPKHDSNQ